MKWGIKPNIGFILHHLILILCLSTLPTFEFKKSEECVCLSSYHNVLTGKQYVHLAEACFSLTSTISLTWELMLKHSLYQEKGIYIYIYTGMTAQRIHLSTCRQLWHKTWEVIYDVQTCWFDRACSGWRSASDNDVVLHEGTDHAW